MCFCLFILFVGFCSFAMFFLLDSCGSVCGFARVFCEMCLVGGMCFLKFCEDKTRVFYGACLLWV